MRRDLEAEQPEWLERPERGSAGLRIVFIADVFLLVILALMVASRLRTTPVERVEPLEPVEP